MAAVSGLIQPRYHLLGVHTTGQAYVGRNTVSACVSQRIADTVLKLAATFPLAFILSFPRRCMQPDKHTSTGTSFPDALSVTPPSTAPPITHLNFNFADVHPFVHP
jgi:hypothetical protein